MSSSLKDLQCFAVCTVVGCSRIKSIALFTHRIGRLKNHHIYRPPADEPCMQSCAARGRPRLFHREHHWIAPVRLAAAQSSPWLRPATYRPSRLDPTNHAVPPDKGTPRKDSEIKGPDNPTSQLLPKMSFNGFSGDREGRKDKGGGERSCMYVCM